ncbi:MAG: hypothetical protein MHPDNHAH_03110 [Anaerolineales bacterium]|nr:hypothetical protein [Anaerolineales bacterium]
MISFTLNFALRKPGMKPHAAPMTSPAIVITGMNNQRDDSAGTMGANTTALAPHAPMMNCPSAPMFHNFMRNAIEHASAVNRIGVALTIVSESTPRFPNEARAMYAYVTNGLPPTAAITTPPRINAAATAPSEIANDCQAEGSSKRGSSRTRHLAPFFIKVDSAMRRDSLVLDLFQRCAGHHQTNRFDQPFVWFAPPHRHLPHDFPLVDHVDAVAQRQQFLQLL